MIAGCGWSHGVGLQVKGGFKLSFLLCCHSTAIIYGSHVAPLLFSPPQPHSLYLGTKAIWRVQLGEWNRAVALPHTLCFSSAKDVGDEKADAETLLKCGKVFVLWGTWLLFLGGQQALGVLVALVHVAACAQLPSGPQKADCAAENTQRVRRE